MVATENNIDIPKSSFLNNFGNTTKNDKEGITNQNMLLDKAIIFPLSCVSMYNQIKARREVSGIEAKIPPIKEFLLETSDIKPINTAEISIFVTVYHIIILRKNYLRFRSNKNQ
jgi:hypothetical protein